MLMITLKMFVIKAIYFIRRKIMSKSLSELQRQRRWFKGLAQRLIRLMRVLLTKVISSASNAGYNLSRKVQTNTKSTLLAY